MAKTRRFFQFSNWRDAQNFYLNHMGACSWDLDDPHVVSSTSPWIILLLKRYATEIPGE